MLKLIWLFAMSLIMPLVGAFTCTVSHENCTGGVRDLHDRSLDGTPGGLRATWPSGKIPYCYSNVNARTQLKAYFDAAIQIWMNALGGPSSAATGHSLAFTEVVDTAGRPLFCFLSDYQKFEQPGTWNDAVRRDAFAIHFQPGPGSSSSTLGYSDAGPPGPPGSNNLVTNMGIPQIFHTTLAHELGHTLGFAHEHQRADRDNYIKYRCNKVQGYEAALHRAFVRYPTMTIQDAADRLCTNYGFAISLGLQGAGEFVTWPQPQVYLTAYDIRSIMHYDSNCWANDPPCHPTKIAECTLSTINGEYIYRNYYPSAEDVLGVRTLYPWRP